MKSNVVVYVFDTRAKADACSYNLQNAETPPYAIVSLIEAGQAFAAAYVATAYHPNGAPDWIKVERGNPSVFVVVASR